MLSAADATSGAASEYVYDYDDANRLKQTTIDIGGPQVVLDHLYDKTGFRTDLIATVGATADFKNTYTPDALGRLVRVEQSSQEGVSPHNEVAEKRVDFTYNVAGEYTTVTRYKDLDGGVSNEVMNATYTHDKLSRLTDLTYTHPADPTPTVLRDFGWTYDAAGRVTSHDSDIAAEDITTYGYDNTNQLTGADYAQRAPSQDEAFAYDESGNRATANGQQYGTPGAYNRLTTDGQYTYVAHARAPRLRSVRRFATLQGPDAAHPKIHQRGLTMTSRREFLAVSTAAGLAPLAGLCLGAEASLPGGRDYYVLQQYQLDTDVQKTRFDTYLREAAIPALNRLGIRPVGVFYPQEGLGPIYMLLRHKSADVLLAVVDKLLADEECVRKGDDALAATTGSAAFKRLESSLLLAFKGMPELQTPVQGPNRVFQLRTYESPSIKTGRKKIEMFNDAGELTIFRRVGLNPVFFGETLIGTKMPNLTYMLGFADENEQKAAWKRFGGDPGWKELRAKPEYADKTILCGITNLLLKPAEYSQI